MPQISGQAGQHGLDVVPAAVPVQEAGDRKAVSEIMNSRTACRGPGRDPGLGGDAAERLLDPGIVQPRAGAGHEQHVTGPGREQPVPFLLVSHQRRGGGRVQREQPRLAGLAVADGQDALAGVEVAVVQGDQLPDAGAGRRQQSDQGRVGSRADRPGRPPAAFTSAPISAPEYRYGTARCGPGGMSPAGGTS